MASLSRLSRFRLLELPLDLFGRVCAALTCCERPRNARPFGAATGWPWDPPERRDWEFVSPGALLFLHVLQCRKGFAELSKDVQSAGIRIELWPLGVFDAAAGGTRAACMSCQMAWVHRAASFFGSAIKEVHFHSVTPVSWQGPQLPDIVPVLRERCQSVHTLDLADSGASAFNVLEDDTNRLWLANCAALDFSIDGEKWGMYPSFSFLVAVDNILRVLAAGNIRALALRDVTGFEEWTGFDLPRLCEGMRTLNLSRLGHVDLSGTAIVKLGCWDPTEARASVRGCLGALLQSAKQLRSLALDRNRLTFGGAQAVLEAVADSGTTCLLHLSLRWNSMGRRADDLRYLIVGKEGLLQPLLGRPVTSLRTLDLGMNQLHPRTILNIVEAAPSCLPSLSALLGNQSGLNPDLGSDVDGDVDRAMISSSKQLLQELARRKLAAVTPVATHEVDAAPGLHVDLGQYPGEWRARVYGGFFPDPA